MRSPLAPRELRENLAFARRKTTLETGFQQGSLQGCSRRCFLSSLGVAAARLQTRASVEAAEASNVQDRKRGLLLGGLIGDALGGPIEFQEIPSEKTGLANARAWPNRRQLSAAELKRLADTLPLFGYEELRPTCDPYGPWRSGAPLGTVTDDSRHKIVLIRALSAARKRGQEPTVEDIARSFLDFRAVGGGGRDDLAALTSEGLREYRYASRWLLGERNLETARPVDRLWSGVDNCSGQMMFPPLAVRYAGRPEQAYRTTFELDFIDTPFAKDVTSALVAGLAAALSPDLSQASPKERWTALLNALRATDPYGYRDVPFAGRRLDKWLDAAVEFARRADGSPKQLYRLLETEGRPVYWWDAHFTLLVPLSLLYLCDFQPLAALHLTLDFGHDTDSYGQVLGSMIGAVHGQSIFPNQIVQAVQIRIRADYGEDLNRWLEILEA